MFTLRQDKKILKRNTFIYLGVSIFVAVFGIIYEMFSHNVYSIYMEFAFVIPLVLGLVPYTLFYFFNKSMHPSEIVSDLYNAGVTTLIVASLYKGVLDIYGTTRDVHLLTLTISGFILLGLGILTYIVTIIYHIKNSKNI